MMTGIKDPLAPLEENTLEGPNVNRAVHGLITGLGIAAKYHESHKTESAGLAVLSVLTFLKSTGMVDGTLLAPLTEALNILERGVRQGNLPAYRAASDCISKYDDFIEAVLASFFPAMDERSNVLSRGVIDKVVGSIAVTYQIRCGLRLSDALKNVVGHDPEAAKRLKNFRYNMLEKDTPRGAREYYFQAIAIDIPGLSPELMATIALKNYKTRTEGKKS